MSYISELLNRRPRFQRWASPSPSTEGEVAVLAFYHPQLEEIGQAFGYPRYPGERNALYAARLVGYLRARQSHLEQQLQRVLAHCPED